MEYVLINLLITLLILGVILWAIRRLGLPEPWVTVITVVVALVMLIYVLRLLVPATFVLP